MFRDAPKTPSWRAVIRTRPTAARAHRKRADADDIFDHDASDWFDEVAYLRRNVMFT